MPTSVDDLVQANLELHEELGKEVQINLKNEAKIRRLESQQARYESDIQYLYNVIENLEIQKEYDNKTVDSLKLQLSELQSRLKDSEETCSEKEKFILFRESQLLELEDTIYRLNKRTPPLPNSEMARTRTDLASLDTMNNDQLLGEIQANSERLYGYSMGAERLPNLGVAENLRDRTARASVLVHNRLVSRIDQIDDALKKCEKEGEALKEEVKRLNTALHNCTEEGGRLRAVIADQSAEYNT